METIYKTFRAEVKDFNDETGEVNLFIPLSSSEWDRDKELVEPASIKKHLPKFMKHPVLVASHDYRDLTNQIGEWQKLKVTETGTEGKPKYYVGMGNEQADWAYQLAKMGAAAFSYGFIPLTWEDGDGEKTPRRTYKEIELLEISQVIIPSNRQAIMAMRAKGVDPIVEVLLDEVEKEIQNKVVDAVTKPEETDEHIRIPVDRGNHEGHRIRTIDISEKEGISAIYCGTDKVIMTYLFLKSKGWDMAKARAWVKEHGKAVVISTTTNNLNDEEVIAASIQTDDIVVNSPRFGKTSQSSIIDEIDYLKSLLTNGLNDEARQSFNELVKAIYGEEVKMDVGGMQEMHDMMSACETMAKKAKKMVEDMMAGEEDEEKASPNEVIVDTTIPLETKSDNDEMIQVIQNTKLGG